LEHGDLKIGIYLESGICYLILRSAANGGIREERNDGRAEGLSGIWKSALKNTLLVNARKQCMSDPVE